MLLSSPAGYKMNEIVNKFYLEGYKFTREMHIKQPEFPWSVKNTLLKAKEEYENKKNQEMHDIFIKTN